jgi:hypothetical protein
MRILSEVFETASALEVRIARADSECVILNLISSTQTEDYSEELVFVSICFSFERVK